MRNYKSEGEEDAFFWSAKTIALDAPVTICNIHSVPLSLALHCHAFLADALPWKIAK